MFIWKKFLSKITGWVYVELSQIMIMLSLEFTKTLLGLEKNLDSANKENIKDINVRKRVN